MSTGSSYTSTEIEALAAHHSTLITELGQEIAKYREELYSSSPNQYFYLRAELDQALLKKRQHELIVHALKTILLNTADGAENRPRAEPIREVEVLPIVTRSGEHEIWSATEFI